MTAAELSMAIVILESDIKLAEGQLQGSELKIKENEERIDYLYEVIKTNQEALFNLKDCPVSSISEFQSLKKGIAVAQGDMINLRAESRGALKARNSALSSLPKMKKLLVQLEDQLKAYVPPKRILEFK